VVRSSGSSRASWAAAVWSAWSAWSASMWSASWSHCECMKNCSVPTQRNKHEAGKELTFRKKKDL
jgi:hypothetical protein